MLRPTIYGWLLNIRTGHSIRAHFDTMQIAWNVVCHIASPSPSAFTSMKQSEPHATCSQYTCEVPILLFFLLTRLLFGGRGGGCMLTTPFDNPFNVVRFDRNALHIKCAHKLMGAQLASCQHLAGNEEIKTETSARKRRAKEKRRGTKRQWFLQKPQY